MSTNHYFLPTNQCPACKATLDASTPSDPNSPGPTPGDYSICIYCGSFLVFKENLGVRLITEEEITNMEDYLRIELIRIRRIIKEEMLGKLSLTNPKNLVR